MMWEHPFALSLVLLLLPLLWLARRSQAVLEPNQGRWTLVLQCLCLLSLVLALAQPLWLKHSTRGHHVVVLSPSAGSSLEELQSQQAQLEKLQASLPLGDRFHVLEAGQDKAPDLAASIRHARRLVPDEEPGEILLFSDGRHDGADLRSIDEELGSTVLHWQRQAMTQDLRLVDVEHPASLFVGEPFTLAVDIECPAQQQGKAARLQVWQGSDLQSVGEASIKLRTGASRHSVAVSPTGKGLLSFEVRLVLDDQSNPQRHHERFALLAQGQPNVAYLGSADRLTALQQTLAAHDLSCQAADLTQDNPFANADAVIVDNLAASAWSARQQSSLTSQVMAQGAGLLMAGTHQNLGPGGYAQSRLARILPVEMPQREERRDPSVSLVIILDTSGSMGGARIGLAKEVARLAMKRLSPHDKVGIVEFYGSKRWAAPLQPASNTIEIQRALNRMQAGGGTIIFSALEESYYALLNTRTRFKHVLVLTDGGVEQGDFESLARRMAQNGQTLSTVLVGPQGNSKFLLDMAQWGRGRFYACPSRFQLPELRFKEPQSSVLPAVQDQSYAVARAGLHEATQSFGDDDLPAALSMVDASLRSGASLLLAAPGNQPLLSSWDQGLGRTMVYCTDLLGPGAEKLREDPRYAAFLADLVRNLCSGRKAKAPRLVLQAEGSMLRATLHSQESTYPLPTLRVANGSKQSMVPVGQGQHQALLGWPSADAPFTVEVNGSFGSISAGALRPLSRVLRSADQSAVLANLVRHSGGKIDDGFGLPKPKKKIPVPLTPWLLLMALALFLFSLLVRRWPWRRTAHGVLPLLAVFFCMQALPAQEQEPDPIQARIQQALQTKGDLGALQEEWKDAEPAKRVALALAEGDLWTACELLKGDASQRQLRLLLLSAIGENEEALALAEEILGQPELDSQQRLQWLMQRADCYLALEQREAAEQDLRAAAQLNGDTDFQRALGLLAGSHGFEDLALSCHRVDGLTGKEALHTCLRRALWQDRLGQVDAALLELETAYQHARLLRDRRFVLSRMTSLMRNADRLPELLQRWQAQAPRDIIEMRAQLALLRELLQGDAALDLLARHEQWAEELQGEGLAIAMESGKPQRAIALAREQLAAKPKKRRLRVALAMLLTDLRQLDAATQILLDGIPHASGRRGLSLLGTTASELDAGKALKAVQQALRERGKPADRLEALMLEVAHLQMHKQERQAVALVKAALDKFTDHGARMRLAETMESLGEAKEALALYRQLQKETDTEDLALRLAWLLSQSEDEKGQEEALLMFKKVWLVAGSEARRVQAEEQVLDHASRQGKLADLAIELEEALEDPELAKRDFYRQALVKIYSRAQDSYSAAEILQEFVRQPGKEVERQQQLARMYWETEDYKNHERSLRKLIQIDPDHRLDYLQEMAMSAMERGNPGEAKAVLDEMAALKGEGAQIAMEFAAGVYSMAGRSEDAIRIYRRTLALHPDRIETLLLQANAMVTADKQKQAIGMFAYILLQDNKDDLFLVAADGLLNMDADAKILGFAARAVTRRLAHKPSKVYLHRVLQDLLEALKAVQPRQHSLEDTLMVAGERRTVFLRELMEEASSEKRWGDYVNFGHDLLALGEEVPPNVFLALGEAMLAQKNHRGAEQAFARARLATDFASVERRVATVYQKAGMLKDSERVRRRILRRDAKNPQAMLDLAAILEKQNQIVEARDLFIDAAVMLLAHEKAQAQVVDAANRQGRYVRRNRNKKDTGKSEQAIHAVLRCMPTQAQLHPLVLALGKQLAASETAAERWSYTMMLQRLPGSDAEVLKWTEQCLAMEPTDQAVVASILDRRLRAGDLVGATAASQRLEKKDYEPKSLSLSLLQGKTEESIGILQKAPPGIQSQTLATLYLLGEEQAANALLDALLQSQEIGQDRRFNRARKLLDRPEKKAGAKNFARRQALHQAMQLDKADEGRVLAVLQALQALPELPAEERAEHLRELLPSVETNEHGRQEFLSYAKEHLKAEELLPVFKADASERWGLVRCLPLLTVLPAEEQLALLENSMRGWSASDANNLRLQALAVDLASETKDAMLAGLQLGKMKSRDGYQLINLLTSKNLDPLLGRKLFAKMRAQRSEDPMTWVMGVNFAENAADKNHARCQALLHWGKDDKNNYAANSALAILLEGVSKDELASLFEQFRKQDEGSMTVLATLLQRQGRGQEVGGILQARFNEDPEDGSRLQALLAWLQAKDQKAAACKVLEQYIQAQKDPMMASHYVSQLVDLHRLLGQAAKGQELLNQQPDARWPNLGLRLQLLQSLEDSALRQQAGREFLRLAQAAQAQGSMRGFRNFGQNWDQANFSPRDAWQLELDLETAPTTAKDCAKFSPFDLLALMPEGMDMAEALLRNMDAAKQDSSLGLYRGYLGSAQAQNAADTILVRARKKLLSQPMHGESLRLLFAAAQLGMPVEDREVASFLQRHLCLGQPDKDILMQATVLCHNRGQTEIRDRLLQYMTVDRSVLSDGGRWWRTQNQHSYQVLALAAQVQPQWVQRLLPAETQEKQQLGRMDTQLMQALWQVAKPAGMVRTYQQPEADKDEKGGPLQYMVRQSPDFQLTYSGWLLRNGQVAEAVQSLSLQGNSQGYYQGFAPRALACAIPDLQLWADPTQVPELQTALLESLEPWRGHNRMLALQLSVLLAKRLQEANRQPEALALANEITQRASDLPQTERWLRDLAL